jgi:hypothetical protein
MGKPVQDEETQKVKTVRYKSVKLPEPRWVAEDRREIARDTWQDFLEMIQAACEEMQ